jgi:hypothetical protein
MIPQAALPRTRPTTLPSEVAMTRRMLGTLAIVAAVFSSACTLKVGGAPPTNYDLSELETYGRPFAESPSYETEGSESPVGGLRGSTTESLAAR